MARFEVEMFFMMRCVTRGWTIEANSAEEAEEKACRCIDQYGQLDQQQIEQTGLKTESWDTLAGTDGDYELDVVEELVS